jgi:glycine hydroxymethyltransferase
MSNMTFPPKETDNSKYDEDFRENISALVYDHEVYQQKCLPLIASENRVSRNVMKVLTSDLQHRYAEGLPTKRLYPGLKIFDQIELQTISMMKQLFNAKFADVRPISGALANLAMYAAFTNPGDYIMSLGVSKGGHITIGSQTLGGTAGAIAHLNVARFAFDEDSFNIDVSATKKIWKGLRAAKMTPKLVIFGGSVLLFPQPVNALAEFMHEDNAIISYDAAHVAGLIAGGQFQQPLQEGADYMTMSTHKTFFGPQHGAIVGAKDALGDAGVYESTKNRWSLVQRALFPGLLSNHHLANVAGLGVAAEEMIQHGNQYSIDVVGNAQELASQLASEGFNVIGEGLGYTKTHIVLLDVQSVGGGKFAHNQLESANILANKVMLPWDARFGRSASNPSGLRIGVQELTRLGFTFDDMETVAKLISDCLIKQKDTKEIAAKVQSLVGTHTELKYC